MATPGGACNGVTGIGEANFNRAARLRIKVASQLQHLFGGLYDLTRFRDGDGIHIGI